MSGGGTFDENDNIVRIQIMIQTIEMLFDTLKDFIKWLFKIVFSTIITCTISYFATAYITHTPLYIKTTPTNNIVKINANEYPGVTLIKTTYSTEHGKMNGYGSGIFISKNVMVTAAHVVMHDGKKVDKIEYGLDWDADVADKHSHTVPVPGNAKAIKLYKTAQQENDMAVVIFPEDFDVTQWGGSYYTPTVNKSPKTLTSIGYPMNDTNLHGQLYKSGGDVVTILNKPNTDMTLVNTRGYHGMSGSGTFDENDNLVGIQVMIQTIEMPFDTLKDSNLILQFNQDKVDWLNEQIEDNK